MSPDVSSYPPINTLKPVAHGVWIVDSLTSLPGGLPLSVRMTTIRLADGDLLLHSPTPFDAALAGEIEQLGSIRHLVAPSFGHWMYVADWLAAYPEAATWAAPGVRDRRPVRDAGVRLDHQLSEAAPAAWAEEIEHILISGGPFNEVAMFHRPSRTLILTDLVQNLEPEKLTPLERTATRVIGGAAPEGKPAIYLRALLQTSRAEAAEAAIRLIALGPERVIFSHGAWFEADGAARLKTALSWLLPRPSREFAGRTVVITGASSGIGRAAALAFASKGAQLALLARRPQQLDEVAAACEVLGGEAIAIPTDVTDSEAVERAARAAEVRFGPIDVWINNAGVGVVGAFQDTDLALHRRTIEVNLMGAMHGAAAIVPRFVRQGSGILINNISLGAWSPTPFAAAYTASKFGLRGLTASLRQELSSHPRIHVCGVFPAIIDTPGFAHGGNTTGRSLNPGPFLYRPEQVAVAFIRLVRRPRAEVAVGWPSTAAKLTYGAAPRLTEHAVNAALRAGLSRARPGPSTDGAVLSPTDDRLGASGGWLKRMNMPSAHTLNLAAAAVGGLSAVALWAALGRRRGA